MKRKVFTAALLTVCLTAGLTVYGGTGGTKAPAAAQKEASSLEFAEKEIKTVRKKNVETLVFDEMREKTFDTATDLYFINGEEIPYVTASDYMEFISFLIFHSSGEEVSLEFGISDEGDQLIVQRKDNKELMLIDAKKNTVGFSDMDEYMKNPQNSTLIALAADKTLSGLGPMFKDDGRSYDRNGNEVEFDLMKYGIDIPEKDGVIYLPLQTMNDIFEVSAVYNGQKLLVNPDAGELSDQMYEAPQGTVSSELAQYNYSELCLLLDHFYGLKQEHDIDDFNRFFINTGMLEDFLSTDPVMLDRSVVLLTFKYLDDLHSGFKKMSYRSGKEIPDDLKAYFKDNKGYTFVNANSDRDERLKARYKYYKDVKGMEPESKEGPYLYEEKGDTAIITFDSFTCDYKGYDPEKISDDPKDSLALLIYAHKQITRPDSPVKNVVIDLSCNGGGDSTAAAAVLSWFLGSGRIGMKNILTGTQSVTSLMTDLNLDGVFDANDTLAGRGLGLYCLTSSVSFSCGNMVPTAFKDSDTVTLIGKTSGGGANAVRSCTSASGTLFQIAGPMEYAVIRNGSLYITDSGVEPDYRIKDTDTFYDREKLTEFIKGLK